MGPPPKMSSENPPHYWFSTIIYSKNFKKNFINAPFLTNQNDKNICVQS
jgi:hypothetical protein